MKKTNYSIRGMDCPSEENLIWAKLDGISGIIKLEFDIPGRRLTVFHDKEDSKIEDSIKSLKLGGKKVNSEKVSDVVLDDVRIQKNLPCAVPGINFVFTFSSALEEKKLILRPI